MKNEPKTNENEGQNTHWKTLEFDVETYQSLLDDDTISESQKRELLETLWNIIVQFVDLGFGVEATQLALSADKRIEAEINPKKEILTKGGCLNEF